MFKQFKIYYAILFTVPYILITTVPEVIDNDVILKNKLTKPPDDVNATTCEQQLSLLLPPVINVDVFVLDTGVISVKIDGDAAPVDTPLAIPIL